MSSELIAVESARTIDRLRLQGALTVLRDLRGEIVRDSRGYVEPIAPGELRKGDTYFMRHFLDEGLMVPEPSPVVYIGRELLTDDAGVLYFQEVSEMR